MPNRPTSDRFEDWRAVGCGVESLHHLLVACGVEVSLDEVLREALARDGYDEDLGWRHRALVDTAATFGVPGEVCAHLSVDDFTHSLWLASVDAPDQFASTHLIAVRRMDDTASQVRIFWPQGHLEFGERFTVPRGWLALRLTGKGMRFDGVLTRG